MSTAELKQTPAEIPQEQEIQAGPAAEARRVLAETIATNQAAREAAEAAGGVVLHETVAPRPYPEREPSEAAVDQGHGAQDPKDWVQDHVDRIRKEHNIPRRAA